MARKCRHCKTEIPKTKDCTEPVQKAGFCTIDHMAKHGIEKAKATREKKERVEHRKAKENLKSASDWTKEAQKEFNRFVRLDDYKEGCISCNRTKEEVEATDSWVVGGCWDAGHFRSRGAASHLRFNRDNCHKQCKKCNGGAGKFSKKDATVAQSYRENLINKIGLDRVEALENDNEPRKYTIDELKEIKTTYRKKANELAKNLEL